MIEIRRSVWTRPKASTSGPVVGIEAAAGRVREMVTGTAVIGLSLPSAGPAAPPVTRLSLNPNRQDDHIVVVGRLPHE